MATTDSNSAASDGLSSRAILRTCCVTCILLFGLVDDLIGLKNGGGIISVTTAIRSAKNAAPAIDIDTCGLRTVCIAFTCLLVAGLCRLFKWDLKTKVIQIAVVASMIGGGFILDTLVDQPIVQRLMANYDYQRCEFRDHVAGHGKGTIWFDGYTRKDSDCFTPAAGS